MAGQATAASVCRLHGKRSAQARIWKPGRRRQLSGARERWKPEWGETRAARLDAQHDSATGHVFLAGDAYFSLSRYGWLQQLKSTQAPPLSLSMFAIYKGRDMADFCITAVRYNQDRSHIEFVQVKEEKPAEVGPNRTVSRAFVADLIRLGKATFQTRTKAPDGKWKLGAQVHLIDDVYLTTNKNSTKRDNLENLPEF